MKTAIDEVKILRVQSAAITQNTVNIDHHIGSLSTSLESSHSHIQHTVRDITQRLDSMANASTTQLESIEVLLKAVHSQLAGNSAQTSNPTDIPHRGSQASPNHLALDMNGKDKEVPSELLESIKRLCGFIGLEDCPLSGEEVDDINDDLEKLIASVIQERQLRSSRPLTVSRTQSVNEEEQAKEKSNNLRALRNMKGLILSSEKLWVNQKGKLWHLSMLSPGLTHRISKNIATGRPRPNHFQALS